MPTLETLISAADIQAKVAEMGAKITADYADQSVILVGVLKGCVPYIGDLARAIDLDLRIDYVQVASWHGKRQTSGVVHFKKDHDIDIEGQHVILVEDIVDTGLTLQHLRDVLQTRRPASLAVATLLSKSEARVHQVPVEYIGFEIPNRFVVGYGLDDAEKYRNLADIAVVID